MVLWAQRVLPALLVFLDPWEWKVLLAPLESGDRRVTVVARDPRVAPDPLAVWVQWVSLDPLAIQDLPDLLALQVKLVRREIRDLKAALVTMGPLATKDLREARDPMDLPVKSDPLVTPVWKVSWDLWAQS